MDVLAFGEILWDVIDGEAHLGGAPFNFAAHAARCGLDSAIVSAVGDDDLGRRALSEAARLGVGTAFVSVVGSLPTGTVLVTLENGMPSYDIVHPVAWDEIAAPPAIGSLAAPRALYFGTLAQRSETSAKTLRALLDAFPSSLAFFDVNLRQSFWSDELVRKGIAQADVLKVNDEEMAALHLTFDGLFGDFPRLSTVVETLGARGCRVASRDGRLFERPAVPDGPVVDTVGAGDSFSAAFLATLLNGGSLEAAAEAGNRLAGKVAARAGAIPADIV